MSAGWGLVVFVGTIALSVGGYAIWWLVVGSKRTP